MRFCLKCGCVLMLTAGGGLSAHAAVRVVPQPQYLEGQKQSLVLVPGSAVAIRITSGEKVRLGAEMLRAALVAMDASLNVSIQTHAAGTAQGPTIHLWNGTTAPVPDVALNFLDRQVLAASHRYGQSYVLRTPDARSTWVIGNSDQGVLLGTMTVLQLLRRGPQGLEIPGVYVRDYPDFEFRAAADWLLNVEANRWALDRGQGLEAFTQLCERKLDAALRFKINMVLIDGFGWGLDQRFKEYGSLMRRLNRYARQRGIHLYYGGYGAGYGLAYQGGPIYEDAPYLGRVFENRDPYPNGPTYRCMGFPAEHTAKTVDAAVLGTCRANDALNRAKADELQRFVEAVEPGALYIHHEDFGGFNGTQAFWRRRCERCRARWSNDALAARDGGAGALAHGYSELVRAVNRVKNPASGYDAARDCQILLVSPVYMPDSPASDDWSNVLELWQNTALQLPKADNVQIVFREVFPQKSRGARWAEHFAQAMSAVGLSLGMATAYAGGADTFHSDYPLTGTPALNAAFLGSRTIYNFSGDFYGEPMAAINAEFSWNAHSPGWADPATHDEAIALDRRYTYEPNQPEAVFAPGGLYSRVCELMYGPQAGTVMADYYRQSAWIPDVEIKARPLSRGQSMNSYLPSTWNRVHLPPTHWRDLALDSKTWDTQFDNERYLAAYLPLKIDRRELHRRLARRWHLVAGLNKTGAHFIALALAAGPSPESRDDLVFLQQSFRVYQPFTEALADFHTAFQGFLAADDPRTVAARFASAEAKGQQARTLAAQAFPHPVDPSGGEVGTLRRLLDRFVDRAAAMQRRVGGESAGTR
jgi:hypothetical protein